MGGSASTEASCLEAATRICEVAATEEGQRRLAREDVRGVLVTLGRRAEGEEVRDAVATAIAFVAKGQEGARVMATADVRAVLVTMGRQAKGDEVRRLVATAIVTIAHFAEVGWLMATEKVREVLVAIGGACGGGFDLVEGPTPLRSGVCDWQHCRVGGGSAADGDGGGVRDAGLDFQR